MRYAAKELAGTLSRTQMQGGTPLRRDRKQRSKFVASVDALALRDE